MTPAAGNRRRRAGSVGFGLFLLLNVILLVRPQEMWKGLAGLQLYFVVMAATLLACWPVMLPKLSWVELKRNPITVCVLALVPITALAALWQSRMDQFVEYAVEYAKIALYYLVLVAVVDTPERLKKLCLAMGAIIAVIAAIAVLDLHGFIHLDAITRLTDADTDKETGAIVRITRLQSVGIFQDPNDLAQILAVGVVLCVYGVERAGSILVRLMWLGAMGVMLYAVYKTQSRGGLLCLVAAMGMLFVARFGVKKAIIVGGIAMPLMLAMYAGRQTDLSTMGGSAQTRVQLWSDALQAVRHFPVFGIGPGNMYESSGQVAHNSFLHAFAELGFVGGWLLLTAYWVAIRDVLRVRNRKILVLDEDLRRLTPALAAALVGYLAGMMSLTRNYVTPTYLMLGLACVYISLVQTEPVVPRERMGMRLLGKTFACSVLFLLAVQAFVKVSVRWSE